jgi:ABC-type Zn uptake system ZnuABC Zn-binding protein ZnuA
MDFNFRNAIIHGCLGVYRMRKLIVITLLLVVVLSACQPAASTPSAGKLRVVAVESYLADMVQRVAGDRLQIEALMPLGVDPHSFEPTPQDIAKISNSQVLVINGAGFESWLAETLANAGGKQTVIEASQGLTSRQAREGEAVMHAEEDAHEEGDPHFWLDAHNAIRYVENIRDGLIQADPEGRELYTQNAATYIDELKKLDAWITEQVQVIPVDRRQIVTNHESFGYYADRYGFKIIGTVIPSVSSESAPSAQQLALLIDTIRQSGAQVIFLETGANPQLAQQIAEETDVKVVTDLYTHSLSGANGPAPSYIEMMRYNTRTIVDALK